MELYNKLVCALTHDLRVCDKCKKCGDTSIEARIQMIRELAEVFETEVPREE